MSADAKRVQAVFLAAAAAADPAHRAAILDRECAADAELRQRVEALLRAHDEPAGDSSEAIPDGTVVVDYSTDQQEKSQAAPAQDPVPEQAGNEGDEEKVALEFLQPSTKPGSLGLLGHYEVLAVLG